MEALGGSHQAAQDHEEAATIAMGRNRVEGGVTSSPLYTSATSRSGAPCQDRASDFLTSSHEGLQGPETLLTLKSWSPP